MLRRYLLLCLAVLSLIAAAVSAQEATPEPDPTITTAYQQVVVYAGPGTTFTQNSLLNPGVEATIVERNHLGNWLRLIRTDPKGLVVMDGWVVSAYLNLDPALDFGDVPVNSEVADADPATMDSRSLQQLYAAPVIPTISPAMREVFQKGQELGNDPRGVTKIGDSLIANPMYLTPMSEPEYDLGPYDYLADTIAYFGPSTAVESAAARIGLGSYVVFDPMWADKERCGAGESPLICEYRLKQPSVALIMFGPNDVKHMAADKYEEQMRRIVEETLSRGIIPVLFTFSYDPNRELWWQSVGLNLALIEVAADYEIPLVNLWAAARILPDYGLDIDHLHMKNSGFLYLKFSGGNEAFYGVTLQNLLAVRVLDEIRRTVIEPA